MTTQIDVINLALSEIGQRIFLNSLSDNQPAAAVARINYTPRMQALLRAANWNFCRAQITLTLWKSALVAGQPSPNPPPQPWLFSYLRPPDCLKARFVLPTVPVAPPGVPLTGGPTGIAWTNPVPTGIPFVIATDYDSQGNPINVILTNLCDAQVIYTRDLSQVPDLWDDLFLSAATSYLGSYFIMALARDQQQYASQVAATKGLLDQARVANGDEAIPSIDRTAEWIAARRTSGINYYWNQGGGGGYGSGWGGSYDSLGFSDGLRY